MWAIDRTHLIILGVVLGIAAVAGLFLLLAPPTESASDMARPSISNDPLPPIESVQDDAPPTSVAERIPDPVAAADPIPEPANLPPVEQVSPMPIVDGIIHTGEYAHAMEAGGFHVYWSSDSIVLRIGLLSPGTGYVAIGFDPDQRMQGANYIIGTVRNGRTEIRDDYGMGPLTHGSDIENGGTDNILAAAGRELDGQTTLEFVIPLDSGDPFDKPLTPGGTYDVLVAFHDTSDSFSTRHSQRGSGEIRLDDVQP
jgi:hypothetical protein